MTFAMLSEDAEEATLQVARLNAKRRRDRARRIFEHYSAELIHAEDEHEAYRQKLKANQFVSAGGEGLGFWGPPT